MASDLSSGCTDDIDIFEEKEEGELSLEDVSSSEESHPNYRSGYRAAGRCPNCMALQICATWCEAARAARKIHKKQDAAHGKENRRHIKDPSGTVPKHMVATLQEKNDDLVPISSDSDMEIVGLPGNSKQLHARSKSAKVRKKKKKKRGHSSVVRIDDSLSPGQVETYLVDVPVVKKVHTSRSHHREPSPPRYSVRSPLERTLPRSPSRRYRATRPPKSRSPPRRSRSPAPRINPVERKSPRKLRSPRRSPALRSPVRSTIFRDARDHASPPPSPQTHIDVYATKLLKKVRRLESVGGSSTNDLSKNKEHSSLKEKLSNMMKKQADGSQEKHPVTRKHNSANVINNNNNTSNGIAAVVESDDEDDIELLRRLALETKQNKAENKIEESRVKSETSANADESDDNDIEANELRILALRSAIMKKHEKRVTRGMKSKRPAKSATRVESPFNESFLDDIHISEPEEEESSIKSPATRSSPILDYESNHPEDMDIDTDVEREKEKDLMPYSPTDDLTREIVMEVELLESNDINNEQERLSVMQREKNVTNERNTSPENSDYTPGVNNPYSPAAPTENQNLSEIVETALENAEKPSSLNNSTDSTIGNGVSYYLPGVDTPFSPARTMEITQSEKSQSQVKNIANTERPYSPTDTPILDPHLFPIFPNLPVLQTVIDSIEKTEDNESSATKMAQVDDAVVENPATIDEATNEVVPCDDSKTNLQPQEVKKCESPSTIDGPSELSMPENSFKPIDTMDKLPEVDLDGSPLVPVSKELESVELVIPIEMSPEIATTNSVEPLYLQSLSDVTKDTNKIPTLVNRTLVPALILKTNKQLQQPLPQKKVDNNHTEPSFKSAEMRPVNVDTAQVKLTTMFKPIKLCPISKKSQVMTTTAAAAFNTSFGDDSIKETKSDNEGATADAPALGQQTKTITGNSPVSEISQEIDDSFEQKKKASSRIKRRRKLRDKRKSSAVAESPIRESNRESVGTRAKSAQSYLNNSSRKKDKSMVGSASELNERVTTRATFKALFVKSSSGNFNDSTLKDDKYTQREASDVKKATVCKNETGQVEAKKKRSPKKTRRSKKKVKRLSNSYTDTSNKSSELDVTKSNEHTVDKSAENEQMETNKNEQLQSKAVETSKKVDDVGRKRRCSIDEDEEALRALLLASLPKRTKPVEAGLSTPPENPIGAILPILDRTSGMSVQNLTNKVNVSTACLADTVASSGNALSNQSSNTSSATQAKVVAAAAAAATTKDAEEARKILRNESNSSSVEASPLTLRKRANSVVVKGPPKKIAKKALPVLASTKVVNNAKKYQNALMQKKLNLQRAAMNYGAQNGSRNITLNNLKSNDAARPSSPKISAASKTQRLVINLGSDTDSETDLESQPANSNNSGEAQVEGRKPLAIPTTDFEKSVVQFLKDQRKKLESVTVSKAPASSTTSTSKTVANTASPATGKLSGLYNTPLAVRRHLPMSQQEEYRRLKQQIAEREREKLRKTIENGSASCLKSPCTPPGPLSPASPIAAIQKTQINNKVSGVATEVAATSLAPSKKDKILEKAVVQKKMELVKANENRLAINVTKASKLIVPPNPNKQITKPLAASTKVNSNIPNISSTALTPKAPVKVVPKASSSIPSSSILAITSTPKAQLSISSKARSNISSRAYLSKQIDPTGENSGKFGAVSSRTLTKISLESSTSVSTCNEDRWSVNASTLPPLPAMALTSASGSSLKPTEILTIQIPNDKIQTDRGTTTLTGISRGESSSPPNGRNVGMLKILTKEQLNSRFVQIQVKQGTAGRKVTVGGSTLGHDSATRSASSSPIPRLFSEGRNDQSDKKTCCDSNLIVNKSTVTRRGVGKTEESMVADSEASTLVLSRDEGNCRKNRSDDSEASTFVVVHENSHNDRNADSEASTLVLGHDISESRDSPPGMARTEESEDGGLAVNAGGVVQTKLQVNEGWEKIRSDVKNELEILTALPPDQQRSILVESQENLVAKRNMVLDDLTEMAGCLCQWEVEREIQTKLIAEVRHLREQLRTAEKHLREQRRRMNGMGPKVTKAHEKINHGRRECYKLSRICHGLGTKLMGEEYKVPDTSAQLLTERLTKVAVHTRQLSKKKVPPIDSINDSRDTNSPASSTASDTVSESSFVDRPSSSTTPFLLSYATNIEEPTNSLPSEIDLDDTGKTRGNSEPPEVSTTDSPCRNPISVRANVTIEVEEKVEEEEEEEEEEVEEEKEKSSETNAQSEEETIASNCTEKYAQKRDNEGSSSSETNAQIMEKAEPKFLKIDAQTNIEEASCSSEGHTNYNSDVAMTNLFSIGRYEDISIPSTSKSEAHCDLMSSDDQPPVKSKIDPYKSVLTHLKGSRSVNPDGILCPYELMGTCSDGDCQFYHLDPGHCQ